MIGLLAFVRSALGRQRRTCLRVAARTAGGRSAA